MSQYYITIYTNIVQVRYLQNIFGELYIPHIDTYTRTVVPHNVMQVQHTTETDCAVNIDENKLVWRFG